MRKPQIQDFVSEKPDLTDFGMTRQEYQEAKSRHNEHIAPRLYWTCVIGFCTSLLLVYAYNRLGGNSGIVYLIIVASMMSFGFVFIYPDDFRGIGEWLNEFKGADHRRSTDPQFDRVQCYEVALARYIHGLARYKTAMAEYNLTLQDHWKSLKGTVLENELAALYSKVGYAVRTTRATGDKGVDLILEKNGQTTVVQCKGHKKSVGVGVVRDLYGALIDSGADSGVLVCPEGFTKGVEQFVNGKPIELIDARALVTMAENSGKWESDAPDCSERDSLPAIAKAN